MRAQRGRGDITTNYISGARTRRFITAFTTGRTGSCPDRVESNTHPSENIPKILSDPILPSTLWFSERFPSIGLSNQKLCTVLIPLQCVPHSLPTSFALTWSA
jgi:hypothetical protein